MRESTAYHFLDIKLEKVRAEPLEAHNNEAIRLRLRVCAHNHAAGAIELTSELCFNHTIGNRRREKRHQLALWYRLNRAVVYDHRVKARRPDFSNRKKIGL